MMMYIYRSGGKVFHLLNFDLLCSVKMPPTRLGLALTYIVHSVRYWAGRGGFSLTRPRPYTVLGGYVWGNSRLAPVRG